MDNDWGSRVVETEAGEREIDAEGNARIPMQTRRVTVSHGFTTYDPSSGHCELCGSLTCRGMCFR
jgi:hypothetical protein